METGLTDMCTFSVAGRQSVTKHNWPEVDVNALKPLALLPGDVGAALKTIKHLVEDITAFTSVEEPYSVQADIEGIEAGEFMVEHADVVMIVKERRDDLQTWINWHDWHTLGCDQPKVSVMYFKNWANNAIKSNGLMLHCKPTHVHQVGKLIEGVKKMNEQEGKPKIKVGCGGAYHSWSPLFPDKSTKDQVGLILSMYELQLECQPKIPLGPLCDKNQRIRFCKDDNDPKVTIAPGVTPGELMESFLSERYCFESDVIIGNVTYGGVLSTGCHGVGKDQTAMSDWISSLKIVDHEGRLHSYPEDLPNHDHITKEEFMRALQVNMGLFGVVVEITMRVKPMTSARVKTSYPTIGSLLYGTKPELKALIEKHWSLQFMWFPFSSLGALGGMIQGLPLIHIWQPKADQVMIRAIDKVETFHETSRFKKLQQKLTENIEHITLAEIGTPLIKRYPALIPAVVGGGFDMVKKGQPEGENIEELPYAIHFRYGVSEAPVYDMEFAFGITFMDEAETCLENESFERIKNALCYVVEKAEEEAKLFHPESRAQNYPLSTTMDMRIIKRSDTLLCPASKLSSKSTKSSPPLDGTHTAFIEILSFAGTENYKAFFKKIGKKWMELGGVPNWGKQWTFLEEDCYSIFNHIRNHYGENLQRFKEIMHVLNGDSTLFTNSTMQKILED